jgi:hypothetical protein
MQRVPTALLCVKFRPVWVATQKGLAIQFCYIPLSVRRRGGGATCPHAANPGRVTMHRIFGIGRERGLRVVQGQTGDSTDRPVVLITKI